MADQYGNEGPPVSVQPIGYLLPNPPTMMLPDAPASGSMGGMGGGTNSELHGTNARMANRKANAVRHFVRSQGGY